MKLIDKDALITEIDRQIKLFGSENYKCSDRLTVEERLFTLNSIKEFIDTLEVKDVDLEKESELIANGIMISVQSNKYGTNIYNTKRNDFNHYHLQMAARKGIEFGIKAQKGE